MVQQRFEVLKSSSGQLIGEVRYVASQVASSYKAEPKVQRDDVEELCLEQYIAVDDEVEVLAEESKAQTEESVLQWQPQTIIFLKLQARPFEFSLDLVINNYSFNLDLGRLNPDEKLELKLSLVAAFQEKYDSIAKRYEGSKDRLPAYLKTTADNVLKDELFRLRSPDETPPRVLKKGRKRFLLLKLEEVYIERGLPFNKKGKTELAQVEQAYESIEALPGKANAVFDDEFFDGSELVASISLARFIKHLVECVIDGNQPQPLHVFFRQNTWSCAYSNSGELDNEPERRAINAQAKESIYELVGTIVSAERAKDKYYPLEPILSFWRDEALAVRFNKARNEFGSTYNEKYYMFFISFWLGEKKYNPKQETAVVWFKQFLTHYKRFVASVGEGLKELEESINLNDAMKIAVFGDSSINIPEGSFHKGSHNLLFRCCGSVNASVNLLVKSIHERDLTVFEQLLTMVCFDKLVDSQVAFRDELKGLFESGEFHLLGLMLKNTEGALKLKKHIQAIEDLKFAFKHYANGTQAEIDDQLPVIFS